MIPEQATKEVVTQLTISYLQRLTANELQDHFIKMSNRFSAMLNEGAEAELYHLQSYLRMITAEMSSRIKSNKQ